MSSTTTTTASGLAGAWFGELASALQGKWQAVAASGEQRPRQQRKLGAGGLGERSTKASGEAAGAVRKTAAKEEEEDVGMCGGAMSDATLCLLLDRFAPS